MPPILSPLADPSGSAPAALPPAQAASSPAPLSLPSSPLSVPDQFALDLPARQGLDEVRGRVLADDEGKWDVILPRQSLLMDRGTLLMPSEYEGDYPPAMTLSPWATAQACTRLHPHRLLPPLPPAPPGRTVQPLGLERKRHPRGRRLGRRTRSPAHAGRGPGALAAKGQSGSGARHPVPALRAPGQPPAPGLPSPAAAKPL